MVLLCFLNMSFVSFGMALWFLALWDFRFGLLPWFVLLFFFLFAQLLGSSLCVSLAASAIFCSLQAGLRSTSRSTNSALDKKKLENLRTRMACLPEAPFEVHVKDILVRTKRIIQNGKQVKQGVFIFLNTLLAQKVNIYPKGPNTS